MLVVLFETLLSTHAVSVLHQAVKEICAQVGSGGVDATTREWGAEVAMRAAEIQLLGVHIKTSNGTLLKSS
jgi:hypothetical protein